jgi:flagellar biosynthetic protein FliR
MELKFDFITVEILLSFLLAMTRVLALFMTAPLLSRSEIPVTIKIGTAGVITLSVYDQVVASSQGLISTNPWSLGLEIAFEILIGSLIGFLANLVLDGTVSLSQIVGIQFGQSSASVFNPAVRGVLNPAGILYFNFTTLIFLMAEGLYLLINLISKSFELIPLAGTNINLTGLLANAVPLFNNIFISATRFMLPLIAIMLITDIFAAIIAKILPQANMFFLVMPVKLILGMIIMSLTLNSYTNGVAEYFHLALFEYFADLFK